MLLMYRISRPNNQGYNHHKLLISSSHQQHHERPENKQRWRRSPPHCWQHLRQQIFTPNYFAKFWTHHPLWQNLKQIFCSFPIFQNFLSHILSNWRKWAAYGFLMFAKIYRCARYKDRGGKMMSNRFHNDNRKINRGKHNATTMMINYRNNGAKQRF